MTVQVWQTEAGDVTKVLQQGRGAPHGIRGSGWVCPQSRSLPTVPPDICTKWLLYPLHSGECNSSPFCDVRWKTHEPKQGFRPVPPVITLDFTHRLCYGNIRYRWWTENSLDAWALKFCSSGCQISTSSRLCVMSGTTFLSDGKCVTSPSFRYRMYFMLKCVIISVFFLL